MTRKDVRSHIEKGRKFEVLYVHDLWYLLLKLVLGLDCALLKNKAVRCEGAWFVGGCPKQVSECQNEQYLVKEKTGSL